VRVAFVGAFDPEYPRTRVLEEGLRAHGVDVRVLPAPSRPVAREASLVASWISRTGGADAWLVPSFGHRDVPVASLLAHVARVPLLFDPLVSRWDTQVRDLGRVPNRSFAAARLQWSDTVSLGLSDLVLCDTWEHGELFAERFGLPRRKLARVPVGADLAAFARGDERARSGQRPTAAPLDVLYVGGFLPLHGVPVVIQAAALLEKRHGPEFARFTLVGDGMMAHRADRDVASLGLKSVRREPRLPYARVLDALARADVALGIFGTTDKAARVVPHKVYQALAVGVPTVTRRSPAVAEFFAWGRSAPESARAAANPSQGGEPLLLVPPGDASALAAAIEELARDPERRQRIGASGKDAALSFATPERVGKTLLDAIERARRGGR
jgi:glycosyltransferase involved in cell wall biosynthesis